VPRGDLPRARKIWQNQQEAMSDWRRLVRPVMDGWRISRKKYADAPDNLTGNFSTDVGTA
jgi:hypothetical protein